ADPRRVDRERRRRVFGRREAGGAGAAASRALRPARRRQGGGLARRDGPIVSGALRCWCGNADLEPFSSQYRHRPACESLVLADRPEAPLGLVHDDDRDFYGKRYWFEHQEQELGLSNLVTRVRQDLPERCVYWLRTLLTYKVPPATSLELGAS